MSRDMTPAQIEESSKLAACDVYARRAVFDTDLNPYITQGGRDDWQKGYDGAATPSWLVNVGWDHCLGYQWGKQVRVLHDLLTAEPIENFLN